MASILLSAMVFAAMNFVTFSQAQAAPSVDDLTKQAQAAYAQREYTPAGAQKAQEAADLYSQAIALATDNSLKASLLVAQSEAVYFVGVIAEDKTVKIDTFLKGMQLASQAAALLGVPDTTRVSPGDISNLKKTLSAKDLATLGEGLYQKGANLGQWGTANGITESLGKWPELRDTMQLIIDLGLKETHDYGPNRILGRGYYKIPGLLGGSNKKAEKYLSVAVKETLVPGKTISRSGYNNTYYAEVLHEIGKEAEAVALLNEFIAADPASMNPDSIPEIKDSQREARELLSNW